MFSRHKHRNPSSFEEDLARHLDHFVAHCELLPLESEAYNPLVAFLFMDLLQSWKNGAIRLVYEVTGDEITTSILVEDTYLELAPPTKQLFDEWVKALVDETDMNSIRVSYLYDEITLNIRRDSGHMELAWDNADIVRMVFELENGKFDSICNNWMEHGH